MIKEVHRTIEIHCQKVGRDPGSIKLVAVSKKQPIEKIDSLIQVGHRIYGENYVQEALPKVLHYREIGQNLEWHFIGHLQSKKVKDVVGQFHLIHSVDSLDLARKMEQQIPSRCSPNYVQSVLLQVQLGEEETKSGFLPKELQAAYEEILNFKHILVTGLMTMPPLQNEAEQNRTHFQTLKKCLQQLHGTPHPKAKNLIELSMGTSHDFGIAVEEGASIVRIGTSLFGERK
ncbi:MAG: YggS family pyridoxal phosphate-dependent enzyme [Pseudobdellovibrionaceae bacterium]